MIDYIKLYTFGDPISNRLFRGAISDFSKADAEVSRGEMPIKDFVRVNHFMGEAKPKHVIWTSNAHPLIFSETVIELLIKNNITGWDTYPVKIYDIDLKEVQNKYYGFIINGRSGYIDYSRSKIIVKQLGIKDTPHVRGMYFYNDNWDGSDFFMACPDPDNKITMFRFCTKRVYDLFKKNKIYNLNFESITQYDIWYYTLQVGASQRLQKVLNDLLNKASN